LISTDAQLWQICKKAPLKDDASRGKVNCGVDCEFSFGCCAGCVDRWYLQLGKRECVRCNARPDTRYRLAVLPGQPRKCWVPEMKYVDAADGWLPADLLFAD